VNRSASHDTHPRPATLRKEEFVARAGNSNNSGSAAQSHRKARWSRFPSTPLPDTALPLPDIATPEHRHCHEGTSRTHVVRALPRTRTCPWRGPGTRRLHGYKRDERRRERRTLRHRKHAPVRDPVSLGDSARAGSGTGGQRHAGGTHFGRDACSNAGPDGRAYRSADSATNKIRVSDRGPDESADGDACPGDAYARADRSDRSATADDHPAGPTVRSDAPGAAVPQRDGPGILLERASAPSDAESRVAHDLRLERVVRVVRFLAAALVLVFGNALPNIGQPFVIVLGVFIAGYGVIVIVLWARARTPEGVEWASHLTLAADISVVGFALLVFSRDPGWTVYASGFLVITTAGLRFRHGAILAALSLSLTYLVVTAFRVVELGIPVGPAQLGIQLSTYLLGGVVLNQVLPEIEALRSRERDLYEPVLVAQEETGEAVLITENDRPVYWNKAFSSLSGRRADELAAIRSISELIVAAGDAQSGGADSRGPFDGEVLTADGRRLRAEISYRRSRKEGRERKVWILRDAGVRVTAAANAPMHDTLTGLPNGPLFRRRAADLLSWANRKQREVGLLVIDLDAFKGTNDALGREAGDQILIEIATRLTRALRESDTVARIGDDEFVALLPDMSRPEAEQVARSLLRTISAPVGIDGEAATVGASIGISLYPTHAKELDDLLLLAGAAMTAAKRARTGWRTAGT
jgi:diguanylate cyclase (GGDEF)-like protein